jgi:PAS domain S-box-containing protein
MGATDVVFDDDNERFLYVVKRELENVCQRHRFTQTRRALQEAERRCELLLANSAAAIAYVHEGMHIYANDDYFKLFGFEDADELLGLPLLDLMDESFTDEFRTKIKTFRDDSNDEVSFAFRGRSTSGAPIAGQMTLSGAEYEGEHCTQVLVRSESVPVLQDAVPVLQDALPPLDDAEPMPAPAAAVANGSAADPFQSTHTFLAALDGNAPLTGAILVVEIDDFDAMQVELGLLRSNRWCRSSPTLTAELGGARLGRIANHRFAVAAIGSEAGGDVLAERLRESIEGALFEVEGKTVRARLDRCRRYQRIGNRVRRHASGFKTLVAARAANKTNCIQWPSVTALEAEGNTSGSPANRSAFSSSSTTRSRIRRSYCCSPVISLRGDSDEHYEVFLRLVDEKGRRLPRPVPRTRDPERRCGQNRSWVILQSIKVLSVHRSKGHNTRLTINLTRNSLIDDEFIQWLGVAIKAARLPSDAVIFQIAERRCFQSRSPGARFVQVLAMHCRIAAPLRPVTDNPFETLRHVPGRLREDRRRPRQGWTAIRRRKTAHQHDSRAAAARQTDGDSDGRKRNGALSAVASRRELHPGTLPAGTVHRNELRLRRRH